MDITAPISRISIITATYNAEKHLPYLIASLCAQTCKDFEWIVADGASADGTLELLSEIKDINVKLLSEPDTGIYDGLNKAVKFCVSDYYLVLGADDYLEPDAINHLSQIIQDKHYSFVTCSYISKNITIGLSKLPCWCVGPRNYFTGHSVGTLINTKLHEKYGMYDTNLKIAADTKFLLKCAKAGESVLVSKKVIGRFGDAGVSSTQEFKMLSEHFLAHVSTGSNYYLQVALLFVRLVRLKVYKHKNLF